MVYALQVEHGVDMPTTRINNEELLCIPNGEWIVWLAEDIACDIITDEDFKDKYCEYNMLTPDQKAYCDTMPSFEEWCNINDNEVNS